MVSEVYNINNQRYIPWMLDKSIDLICDDPPYFTGPEKRGFYGKKVSSIGVQRVYQKTDSWQLPDLHYFHEVNRIGKDFIIWGANYFDFIGEPHKTPRQNEIAEWIERHPIGWIVWDKCNRDSSFNDFELAYTSFKIPTYIYKFMWNGMLQGSSIFNGHIMQGNKKLNQKRIHPTEKPIPLYKFLYNKYLPFGGSILSNYVGSGADRIAAHDGEYDFYGCEADGVTFTNMENRFIALTKQQKLLL